MLLAGLTGVLLKHLHGLLQVLNLQRCRLPRFGRMQGANAFEDLTYDRRLGRVGKALADMPLAKRGQTLLQGADRVGIGVISQVAGDTVGGGREKAAPAHFEVMYRCLIAAPGIVAGGRLQIALDAVHGPP
ncbi:hypothetical protein D3C77_370870 [compost metagenome]